jgi:ABC-type proline/glycine betaine transport system permease subunit
VPPSIRDAALGIGASKMQAVFHHVLPLAMPGMLTGEDIADVYLFLASVGARCMTGQSLVASRGEVMA